MKKLSMILLFISLTFTFAWSVTISTWHDKYISNQNPWIKLENRPGNQEDWIGIYKVGDNNDWGNVVDWVWAKDDSKKYPNWYEFTKIKTDGEYEARFFLNNTYVVEDKVYFTIGTTIATSKNRYAPNEMIEVNIKGKVSGDKDWIGIYPKGSDNSWSNVVLWEWATDKKVKIEGNLPLGEYEVRLFFHNEYGKHAKARAIYGFSVADKIEGKELILHSHSSHWKYFYPSYFNAYHKAINKLPFSGYALVGDTFTAEVMNGDRVLNYERVKNELKVANIKKNFPNKSMFLVVWMKFPGDLWNDVAWNNVTKNYAILAKLAKELGYKGIIYDNEAYVGNATFLINYDYGTDFDKDRNGNTIAYKNVNYTFKQHTNKITKRFKAIMKGMVREYPSIELMVYHSPVEGHVEANGGINGHPVVMNVGLEREHELIGAMFCGLKKGLSGKAKLYDAGEDYTLRTKEHFNDSYQWRKKIIASNEKNNGFDTTKHWAVPQEERASWETDVNIGFMVTNLPNSSSLEEFDTRGHVGIEDMRTTLNRALEKSDKYVVFYSASETDKPDIVEGHLDWLESVSNENGYKLDNDWKEMITEIYRKTE